MVNLKNFFTQHTETQVLNFHREETNSDYKLWFESPIKLKAAATCSSSFSDSSAHDEHK